MDICIRESIKSLNVNDESVYLSDELINSFYIKKDVLKIDMFHIRRL